MVPLVRSSNGTRARSSRAKGDETRWGAVRWAAAFSSILVVLSGSARSVEADEIEPGDSHGSEPASEPAAEPRPEPKSRPPAPAADALGEPGWIPSIEVGLETFDYNVDTTVVNQINPPAWAGSEKEADRQTMFRVGAELMGPMFEDLPGRPRLFAQGGVQIRLFSSDEIFVDGDPNVPLEPERGIGQYQISGSPFLELPGDFVGQGSLIDSRFRDPSWYAGLGVAFSVPIGTKMLLYVKPSVQYSMEKIDLSGMFTTVDEPVPMVDPEPCGVGPAKPPCIREFFIYRSSSDVSVTDHSVGAGIEVALALARSARPIRVALYAEARFLWLVSGSTTTFADPGGVATYVVTRDDFGIKGGGGLRFSWVGFD